MVKTKSRAQMSVPYNIIHRSAIKVVVVKKICRPFWA